jgi:hypothetical protein
MERLVIIKAITASWLAGQAVAAAAAAAAVGEGEACESELPGAVTRPGLQGGRQAGTQGDNKAAARAAASLAEAAGSSGTTAQTVSDKVQPVSAQHALDSL